MPTALRASRRCVSAVVIIVVVVVVAAAIAAVIGTTAASSTAAAASFFAPLRGGFEELVGVSSCRRVVTGGRVDLFGGVGSFPGEGVVFAALQSLLEQELEVFLSLSCGLVLLGGDPEVWMDAGGPGPLRGSEASAISSELPFLRDTLAW